MRQALGFSRATAAGMLRVDSNRLASYESGRVPIRYPLADAFCRRFNVSQRWLAEGVQPERFYIPVGPGTLKEMPENLLFSEAYQRFLKPFSDEYFKKYAEAIEGATEHDLEELAWGTMPIIGFETREELKPLFLRLVTWLFDACPLSYLGLLYGTLSRAGRMFLAIPPVPRMARPRAAPAESGLTSVTEVINPSPVHSEVTKLLDRVRKAASEPGKKSALAEFLGVARPRVSEWLSGRQEPGGETTLRLLQWVEREESRSK